MNELCRELGEEKFGVWFGNMVFLGAAESKISVSVPSKFFKEHFPLEYSSRIEKKLNELTGKNLSVSLEIAGNRKASGEKGVNPELDKSIPPEIQITAGIQAGNSSQSSKNSAEIKGSKPVIQKKMNPQLQEEYTFDNFIESEDNKLAFNAAKAVASNP
ncbi:MAG: chromosomal replication initiator protein DnaA, partial [Treponema sp.]|nr:chromosomal replication initiator protein DnaA [Treponema sp.]